MGKNMNDTNKYSSVGQALAGRGVQSGRNFLAEVERAKNGILDEFHDLVESHQTLFRSALNDAEALAWQTAYPHLVFPSLAVEKIQSIAAWQNRQQFLHQSNLVFAEAA
jgi:hypothetical protein